MKKYLSLLLVFVLLFLFVGCKKNEDVLSDYASSQAETTSTSSGMIIATDDTDTSTETNQGVVSDTKPDDTTASTENPSSATTQTPRELMNGTWRFVLPENKHTSEVYAFTGHRLVYDLTISDDNNVTLLEKHFKRTDFDTIGDVEYFEDKRYTLVHTSQDVKPGSFAGEISITNYDENTAIINLNGYETATGQYKINENHYLVINDEGQLKWSKAEIISNEIDKQYFPWDSETVFQKK